MTECWPLGAPESTLVELIEDVFGTGPEFEKSFWWGFEAIIPRFGVWLWLVNPKPDGALLDADWLDGIEPGKWLDEDKSPEPKPVDWPNPECVEWGWFPENDDDGSDDAVDDVTIDDVIIDWLDPNDVEPPTPDCIGFWVSTFPKFDE